MQINVTKNIADKTLEKLMLEMQNPDTMTAIYNALARHCDPYVPMRSGDLSQTVNVSEEGVRYSQPYAHYQYVGEVYGPNIPIKEDGEIVGWFSPPGQKKHPTGRKINYKTDYHPLATSHWDQAMMRDKGDEFKAEVKDTIEEFIRRHNSSE